MFFQALFVNLSSLSSKCGGDTISAFKAKQTPGGYGCYLCLTLTTAISGVVMYLQLCSVTHLLSHISVSASVITTLVICGLSLDSISHAAIIAFKHSSIIPATVDFQAE